MIATAFRDITEEVQAQYAMRLALVTLNAMADAVYFLDVETYKITYANQAGEQQLGYSRDELAAQSFMEFRLVHSETTPRDKFPDLISGQLKIWSFETSLRRKDNKENIVNETPPI